MALPKNSPEIMEDLKETCEECGASVKPHLALVDEDESITFLYRCVCEATFKVVVTPDFRVSEIGRKDRLTT